MQRASASQAQRRGRTACPAAAACLQQVPLAAPFHRQASSSRAPAFSHAFGLTGRPCARAAAAAAGGGAQAHVARSEAGASEAGATSTSRSALGEPADWKPLNGLQAVIAGAGPAGCLLAMYLARSGVKCSCVCRRGGHMPSAGRWGLLPAACTRTARPVWAQGDTC
jgi:hypothetical protein